MSDDTKATRRRMAYLRWRLNEGKGLTEQQRKELNSYDAKTHSASTSALNELSFESMALIERKTADELAEVAQAAGLVREEEKITKKDTLERVRFFREHGLVVAQKMIRKQAA